MTAETFAAAEWLYGVLQADSDLANKVHDSIAPQGTTPPYVVFQQQSGVDVTTANGSRIMADLLYLVRVIGAGRSFVALQILANKVDQLLQRGGGSNANGSVFSCTREGVTTRAYTESEGEYREVVLTFRLHAQGA